MAAPAISIKAEENLSRIAPFSLSSAGIHFGGDVNMESQPHLLGDHAGRHWITMVDSVVASQGPSSPQLAIGANMFNGTRSYAQPLWPRAVTRPTAACTSRCFTLQLNAALGSTFLSLDGTSSTPTLTGELHLYLCVSLRNASVIAPRGRLRSSPSLPRGSERSFSERVQRSVTQLQGRRFVSSHTIMPACSTGLACSGSGFAFQGSGVSCCLN